MKIRTVPRGAWAQVILESDGPEPRLSSAAVQALQQAFEELAAQEELRCVVLEIGDCGGAVLEELAAAAPDALRSAAASFSALLQRLHDFRTPVLARAQGHLQGGAVGLAAACDIFLGGTAAQFSLPEACWGLAPILIAPWLIRRVGPASYRRWAFAAGTLDAATAQQLGLLDGLSAGANFPQEYTRLLRSAPRSVRAIKELSRFEAPADSAAIFADFVASAGVQSDLREFAEGRTPTWRKKGAPSFDP